MPFPYDDEMLERLALAASLPAQPLAVVITTSLTLVFRHPCILFGMTILGNATASHVRVFNGADTTNELVLATTLAAAAAQNANGPTNGVYCENGLGVIADQATQEATLFIVPL